MKPLNEYHSNELQVLFNILEGARPKLPTERTWRLMWMNRILDAKKESKEAERELYF